MWISLCAAILIGYFLGNLNGAVIMSKVLHDDVRNHGSGNAGLTNFIRNYGASKAFMVILIDAMKAVLACMAGALIMNAHGLWREGAALGGVAVMLGHAYPVLLGFRGGKGILSGFFVALMVDWRVAILILAVFAVAYLTTRYVSLGSVLAALSFSAGFAIFHHDNLIVMCCGVFMGLFATFLHRQNIVRLIKGQERKTDLFKKDKE